MALLRAAGEECLRQSGRSRADVDLVIHAGVYRTEFLSEPALAAIAAGELAINHDDTALGTQRTLAFDLMNGAAGTLTACLLASQLLDAGRYEHVLVLASEVENNRSAWPENPLGVREGAGAVLLEAAARTEGFSAFAIRWFPELLDDCGSYMGHYNNRAVLFHETSVDFDARLLSCAQTAAEEFLRATGVRPDELALLVPPQRSREWASALAKALDVPSQRVVLLDGAHDPLTTTLARTFTALRTDGTLRPGGLALLIEVSAGAQVVCALYHG